MLSQDPIVITGIGVLTPAGLGVDKQIEALTDAPAKTALADYSLASFNPAPHLTERRLLRKISPSDALGMVAFEACTKSAALSAGTYQPARTGLFIGSPPSDVHDNESYRDALAKTRRDDGSYDEREFGKTCMSSKPTTLLLSLPNNVLCYGAIALDARGANDNYTAVETSGQVAVLNACRNITRGKIDAAVAGGYSAHTSSVVVGMMRHPDNNMIKAEAEGAAYEITPFAAEGEASGTIIADGAAMVSLERRDAAIKRGAQVLAEYVAGILVSDGRGPDPALPAGPEALTYAMRKVLADGGVSTGEVGLVFLSGTGVKRADQTELMSLEAVFGDEPEDPAVATTARVWGNMMEAGGIAEIGLLAQLRAACKLPEKLRVAGDGKEFSDRIDAEKPFTLIVRTSIWGDYSCLLVKG